MNLYESITSNLTKNIFESDIKELASKIYELWEIWSKENKSVSTSIETRKELKDRFGIHASLEDINKAWDLAADTRTEEEPLIINEMKFSKKSDAKSWLDSKLKEYGSTYWFPDKDKSILSKLCEKFGNTYFW